jgi:hypothetical protein
MKDMTSLTVCHAGIKGTLKKMALLKLCIVFESRLRLFTPAAEKACGCPFVQEYLRAFRRRLCPGINFTNKEQHS